MEASTGSAKHATEKEEGIWGTASKGALVVCPCEALAPGHQCIHPPSTLRLDALEAGDSKPQALRQAAFVEVFSILKVRCGVVWCGVVWCGVVWCGVVWCGVVWCGVVCVEMYHGELPCPTDCCLWQWCATWIVPRGAWRYLQLALSWVPRAGKKMSAALLAVLVAAGSPSTVTTTDSSRFSLLVNPRAG